MSMSIKQQLAAELGQAAGAALGVVPGDFQWQVTAANDPRFGDYQTNAAMLLAKVLRRNPRELATVIAGACEGLPACARVEVAGPGFVNFHLSDQWLGARLLGQQADPRLGVAAVPEPRRVVVDFSAPNVAKPMHVGHIRSTIIGDCLARVARFVGHEVITDNHIGDWGTQFGMILLGWKQSLDAARLETDPIAELLRIYREVNEHAKSDQAVLQACRDELVKLQAGDEENLAIWRRCVDLSLRQLREIYATLGVGFDHFLGESFYNDRLQPLVEDLLSSGLAEISDGAVCVFFRDVPELADKPCLIRKQDGGYLYATTDLATIDHRISEWRADDIWYVVGAPQQLHFQQVFEVARRRGARAQMVHVAHGSILGQDRKLMKTRSGDNVGLREVLEEAVERARGVIDGKNPGLPEAEKAEVASIIGIGAVKYAELSQHRMTDYVFHWDRMLSLQGNTAPYLQYSYVRVRSIFRKLDDPGAELAAAVAAAPALADPAERVLALQLQRFAEVVPEVLDGFTPNALALYLHELARAFHSFFEACPVLKSDGPTRAGRLLLCDLTARVLRQGLDLLGIEVVERM